MHIFQEYIIPVWTDNLVETKMVGDVFELNPGNMVSIPDKNGFKLNSCTIYESNPIADEQWFSYYLNSKNKEFSFCSNISKYATLKTSIFSTLTTTPNNIKRLGLDSNIIRLTQREEEEQNYQDFKLKYEERLIVDYTKMLSSDIKSKLLSDDSTIDELFNKPEMKMKIVERILQEICKGSITETTHFEIGDPKNFKASYKGYKFIKRKRSDD